MQNLDTLQRFIFMDIPARGLIVRLSNAYQSALRRHPYPQPIAKLLGKTLVATTLLTATIKFEGKLTLQTQTDGPIHLLVAQADQHFNIRGLAKWEGNIHDAIQEPELLGNGHIGITIAPKEGERYQGIVAVQQQSLSQVLETYFAQSEQLPTSFLLIANEHIAAGMLVQLVPSEEHDMNTDWWPNIVDQLKQAHLYAFLDENLSNADLISQTFPDQTIKLLDSHPIEFRCDCNVERMERAIQVVGQAEVDEILKTHRLVTVTCEFCHHQYDFDAHHIEKIFAKGSDEPPSSVIVTH